MLTLIKTVLSKIHPKFHLPIKLAGAFGVGVGAALVAAGLNPDLATLIGQFVGGLLGANG